MVLCIAFHCIAVHYTTFIHATWIHGYMDTWIHEYMNTWTHERMNTYIPTHTHTPTYLHACMQQYNAMPYNTIPYVTLLYVTLHIYYMIWHNIARVAFITWHRYTHTYIYYTHVCVCVEHLNRCKTSTWWCWFLLFVWLSFFPSWCFTNLNCRFQLQFPF